jgi:hypothetical protein
MSDASEPEQVRVPMSAILTEKIKDYEARETKGGKLNLKELQPGDSVTVEFYPDPGTLQDNPKLYLQVVSPPTTEQPLIAIAAGGPEDWNNKKIKVNGSIFSPLGSSIMPNFICASMFLEIKSLDEELAKLQKEGVEPLRTPIGLVMAEDWKKIFSGIHTPEETEKLMEQNFYGWTTDFSPEVADFKLDTSQRATSK